MKKIIFGVIDDLGGDSGDDGKTPTTTICMDCFFQQIKIRVPGNREQLKFKIGEKVKIEIGE